MVQRDPGQEVLGEQLVDEARVEVEPLLVDRSAAGLHARPGGREPVRVQVQVGQERDVLAVAVVVVARDLAVVATQDGARDPAERVPDGVLAAVGVRGPLDLERGRGGAPEESLGERDAPRGAQGAGRDDLGHPLTAPCMMPATSWRPVKMNSTINGRVTRNTPAMTSE
ncbi:hypothetical protein D3C74_318550 [compost metagenome]